MRRLRGLVAYALAGLIGSLPAAGAPPQAAPKSAAPTAAARTPRPPNLLLVTLDTTRADRLGCYGSKTVATPYLDALAARGVVFDNAISPSPLTLPAHCSILTGLQPAAHGVRDNGSPLADDRVTLAEVLAARGWSTAGFVSAYVLDRRWGIAQGFEHYRDDFKVPRNRAITMEAVQRRGDDTVAKALAWIKQKAAGRFFVWVHLYDPHAPYDPPAPFAARYSGRPYDGEIAWTDALVGRLLDGIQSLGLTQKTVVAVIGDHGEGLGEHGETGHGLFLYETTTHVPLILAGPRTELASRRVREVVRSTDLAPTLLELLGIDPTAPKGLAKGAGQSLVARLAARSPVPAREAYSETFFPRLHFGWSELRAVRTDRLHFIEAPKPELYDLASDPGESVNRAASDPQAISRLRASLAGLAGDAAGPAPAPAETSAEEREKLAALGYAGGAPAPREASFKDLPDPKDRIQVFGLLGRATEAIAAGRTDAGIATLRETLVQDPGMIEAWLQLGRALAGKGDAAGAADAYKKALDHRPDQEQAAIGLAEALAASGRETEAIAACRRFPAGAPGAGLVQHELGRLLFHAGRFEEAEPAFREALRLSPDLAEAAFDLGAIAERKPDFPAAETWFRKAVAIDPAYHEAHAAIAKRRYAAGDMAGAAAELRAALAASPGNPAYTQALADLTRAPGPR